MSKTIKILLLAANPGGTAWLRLSEEAGAIDHALRQSDFRDRFEIEQQGDVRVAGLLGYLLRHKPDIVHFSGHGSESGEIILKDNVGDSHPVSPRALSNVFAILKDNIRCVVLNACYSEQQAQAIAQHIDCVIGMSQAIGDTAAISFSAAFYQALGFGRSVKTAFDLGRVQIDLDNLDGQDTPTIITSRINPENIYFIDDGCTHKQVLPEVLDNNISITEQRQPYLIQDEETSPMYKLVMVIDDSNTVRKIMETCLVREGFEVKAFSNGVGAIRWLAGPHARIPDLIIVDIGLPHIDGYEIIRRLKTKPQFNNTIMIMISRRDGVIDRLKSRFAGAKDYITKPFQTADVVSLVHTYIGLPNLY